MAKKLPQPKALQVDSRPVPNPAVYEQIEKGLMYAPPDDLEFKWELTDPECCPDCRWLSQQPWQSWKKFPTYPQEGLTLCTYARVGKTIDWSRSRCDCLTGDTIVLSPSGLVHLKKLETLDIGTHLGFRSSQGLLKKRPQSVVKLSTKYGYEIKTTLDQKFRTVNKRGISWSRVADIAVGSHILLYRGSLLSLPKNLIEERAGELIGYIAGDGSFNPATPYIGISFGLKNRETAEYISQIAVEVFELDKDFLRQEKREFRIILHAWRYAKILATYGIVKSKFDLPRSPFKSFYFGYLRGLFMADGSIAKNGNQLTLSSANRDFLLQSQQILLFCGIFSSVRISHLRNSAVINGTPCKAQNLFVLTVFGGQNLERFSELIHFFPGSEKQRRLVGPRKKGVQGLLYPVKELDFRGSKRTRMREGLTLREVLEYREKILGTLRTINGLLGRDFIILQVTQKERLGRERVYDIVDVKNTRSFLANNFIAHNCQMLVRFPWGTSYALLPLQDKAFYGDQDTLNLLAAREMDENPDIEDETATLMKYLYDFFLPIKDKLEALIFDYQKMDKFDKVFSWAFLGEPLIVDALQAWDQAVKEATLSLGLDERKAYLVKTMFSAQVDDFHKLAGTIFNRLMHTGQMQDATDRTAGWKNAILEITVSAMLGKITGKFFDLVVNGLKKLGKTVGAWRDIPEIDKVLSKIVKEAETYRSTIHAQYIDDIVKASDGFMDTVRNLATTPPLQWYSMIMNEVDIFTTFWKDTVLIYRPAAAIRNFLDNSLKSINEMLNSLVRAKPFWALQSEKGIKFCLVDEKLFSETFGKHAGDLKGAGYNWLSNLRETLYENLLVKPEMWARKGVFCGKLKRFEKEVFDELAANPDDFADLARLCEEKALKEVNRIFFDYSKHLSNSRVLNNVFPFFDYNVKNAYYWLHDFAHNPWKLKAIIETWGFWCDHTGTDVNWKIKDKLPTYVIPGIYFDPFDFTSAQHFIKVFSKAIQAKPKWLNARNKHYTKLYELLKDSPKLGPRLKSNKGFAEWYKFKEHRFLYTVVDMVDKYLGMSPLVRKGLEKLQLADPQEWRSMFPQSDLIETIGKATIDGWKKKAKREISAQAVDNEMDSLVAAGIYERPLRIEALIDLYKYLRRVFESHPERIPFFEDIDSFWMWYNDPVRPPLPKDQSIFYYQLKNRIEAYPAVKPFLETTGDFFKWLEEEIELNDLARNVLVNWEAAKNIIGFTWGCYLTRHYQNVHECWKLTLKETKGERAE